LWPIICEETFGETPAWSSQVAEGDHAGQLHSLEQVGALDERVDACGILAAHHLAGEAVAARDEGTGAVTGEERRRHAPDRDRGVLVLAAEAPVEAEGRVTGDPRELDPRQPQQGVGPLHVGVDRLIGSGLHLVGVDLDAEAEGLADPREERAVTGGEVEGRVPASVDGAHQLGRLVRREELLQARNRPFASAGAQK
jgi:hypothetical protein